MRGTWAEQTATQEDHAVPLPDDISFVEVRDVLLRLFWFCCHSLLTHWHNSCWADWPAQAGSNRKAGRGKSMKLKLLLLYSIHATYGRIQRTEMPKSLKKTPMPPSFSTHPSSSKQR